MKMYKFIEQYADSIICEPSGMTYTDLQNQRTKKIMIVDQENHEIHDNEKYKEIISKLDKLL